MKGVLLTFEGIEGCGKSTQAQLVFDYLRKRGYRVFMSREPGGTFLGKKIRELVLNKSYEGITDITELFLYLADRAQHVDTAVKPHIEDGAVVICDRFIDSTFVYQGYGRGIEKDFIVKANKIATQKIMPDRTFIIDIDIYTGLKRSAHLEKEHAPKGTLDRIEAETELFHEHIREGFKSLAKKEPKRCVILDGSLELHDIYKSIIANVNMLLKRKKIFRF